MHNNVPFYQLFVVLCAISAVLAHLPTVANRAFLGARSGQTLEQLMSGSPSVLDLAPERASPSAHFSVSPRTIQDNGCVTLQISFTDWTPNPDDVIAISCGPQTSDQDYLDMIFLNDLAMQNPIVVTFSNLTFMRCDYKFMYGGVIYMPQTHFIPLGDVTVPMDEPAFTPKQGHLVYLNNPTTMAVQYVSSSCSVAPTVRYGISATQLTKMSIGTSKTYNASDLCHDPANITSQQLFRDPGYFHTVILDELAPEQVYFYQYGNNAHGWSAVQQFRAAPADTRDVTFITYADQGIDVKGGAFNTTARTLAAVQQGDIDFVLHPGDLGYSLSNSWVWDGWMSLISSVASRVPYMVAVGNHEYDYNRGRSKDLSHPTGPGDGSYLPDWWNNGQTASRGECGVPVYYRFAAPPTGNGIYWYSFTYGNVFVAHLSSEHNLEPDSEQYNWLNTQLGAVDRKRTPWVIVALHRPIYTTQECEEGDYVVSLHLREQLDPLFEKHAVNLVLVAHTHAYERTCAAMRGECVEDGRAPVHMTIGAAGAGLEKCGYSPRFGNFSRAHINEWGFVKVSTTETTLSVQFFLDSDGSLYDSAVLKRWTGRQEDEDVW